MRWVQKVKESDRTPEGRYRAHLILDPDLILPFGSPKADGVTPEEADRLVATADWKIVEENPS